MPKPRTLGPHPHPSAITVSKDEPPMEGFSGPVKYHGPHGGGMRPSPGSKGSKAHSVPEANSMYHSPPPTQA